MEFWRKILLTVMVVPMALMIWLTWGSIFSILMALCLISTGSILLIQKFLNSDRNTDFYEDQNG